ncbi:elongation of very long chain fatty acids protein 4-like [Anopheles bellator]|uniref:elongation of very long chain fatty acids protein 4-like n=1 Tax=Anopheles bellator TaxID=139047 RepID=UPI0026498E7B|nr:elongation of very long chain fatty acids protein 4-like [Anopheles bellator]
MDFDNSTQGGAGSLEGFQQQLDHWYTFLVDDLSDKRSERFPFLYSPLWPLAVLAVYFLLVFYWIPNHMRDRKPYDLRKVMVGYNAFQVVVCYCLIRQLVRHGWTFRYLYACELVDYSEGKDAIGFLVAAYLNYVVKTIELTETVMFALRKKRNQISFLHVYHHVFTYLLAWIFAKYVGGSMLTYTIIVNSMVHMCMYSYYLMAVIPEYVPFKLSKLKRYITSIQIIQLVSILLNILFAMRSGCGIPRTHIMLYMPYMVVLISMFVNFYYKTYRTAISQTLGVCYTDGGLSRSNRSSRKLD